MSAFGDWLGAVVKADDRSRTRIAADIGVSTQGMNDWINGKSRPSWDHCNAITRVFNVPDGLVYRLNGYVDPGTIDWPIAERSLSPEEETIVRAWRRGSDEGQRLLLSTAQVVLRNAAESAEAAREAPQPRRAGREQQGR